MLSAGWTYQRRGLTNSKASWEPAGAGLSSAHDGFLFKKPRVPLRPLPLVLGQELGPLGHEGQPVLARLLDRHQPVRAQGLAADHVHDLGGQPVGPRRLGQRFGRADGLADALFEQQLEQLGWHLALGRPGPSAAEHGLGPPVEPLRWDVARRDGANKALTRQRRALGDFRLRFLGCLEREQAPSEQTRQKDKKRQKDGMIFSLSLSDICVCTYVQDG